MNNVAFSHLKFIRFSDLFLWDFKRYSSVNLKSKYNVVKLSNYIKEENIKIRPFENPEQQYEILGVNNKIGLFDAYVELGKNINQPYKIVKNGFLAYNPYRVNVGSVGLKTDNQKYKYISPAYVVFSCKDGLLPEFLHILFKTNRFNELIRENTTGSVRQSLSFSSLANIKISLPSIEQQQKILEKYNNQIKLAEEQWKKSCEYKKQIEEYLFKELDLKLNNIISDKFIIFTNFKNISRWDYEYNKFFSQKIIDFGKKFDTVKFGSFVELYQYGTSRKANINKKGCPVLRMNNIIDGKLDKTELKYIDSLGEQEIKKLKLEKGDILFNRTNSKELVGKMCVFNEEEEFIFASYLIKIKVNKNKANPFYINYIFNSPIVKEQIAITSRQVTGQANVNTEELSNFLIPLPPLKIQNKIVQVIDNIQNKSDELMLSAKLNKTIALEEFEEELFS